MFFLVFFFVCSKLMKRRHNVFPLSRKRHNRYKITKQLKTGSPVPTFSEFRFSTNMDSRIPSKNHYWSLPTARGRSHPGWRSWATLPSLRTTGYVLSWEITVFYMYIWEPPRGASAESVVLIKNCYQKQVFFVHLQSAVSTSILGVRSPYFVRKSMRTWG